MCMRDEQAERLISLIIYLCDLSKQRNDQSFSFDFQVADFDPAMDDAMMSMIRVYVSWSAVKELRSKRQAGAGRPSYVDYLSLPARCVCDAVPEDSWVAACIWSVAGYDSVNTMVKAIERCKKRSYSKKRRLMPPTPIPTQIPVPETVERTPEAVDNRPAPPPLATLSQVEPEPVRNLAFSAAASAPSESTESGSPSQSSESSESAESSESESTPPKKAKKAPTLKLKEAPVGSRGSATIVPRVVATLQHSGVSCLAFSPDGAMLATGSSNKTVCIWTVGSGGCAGKLQGHSDGINSVAFSPDGSKIATGSDDKTVRVWDASTFACSHTLQGHSAAVRSVAFSPDGSKIATGSDDKTVRVWDASTFACSHTLQGHSAAVRSVAFSPDGSKIVMQVTK